MQKDPETGIVYSDAEVCIGCGTCVSSCPYEIPRVDTEGHKASKCDLCSARLGFDKLPWCVQACPGEARIVGDINDAASEVAKYIASKNAKPLHEEYGTTPSVYYV
jgi:Fe-S-cluster-containing dehydrogenase component